MIRHCTDCGEEFRPARQYHVRCWTCWRRQQDKEASRDAYFAGFADGLQAAGRVLPDSGLTDTGVDAGLLRDVIVLCHPDRHPPERFQQANAATARLLELLDQVRFKTRRRAA